MRDLIEQHLEAAQKEGKPNSAVAIALEQEVLAYFVGIMQVAKEQRPDLSPYLAVSEAVVTAAVLGVWEP